MPTLLALELDMDSRSKRTSLKHPVSGVYDDYAEALRRSPAELVYVSLHNSTHYEWALKSL